MIGKIDKRRYVYFGFVLTTILLILFFAVNLPKNFLTNDGVRLGYQLKEVSMWTLLVNKELTRARVLSSTKRVHTMLYEETPIKPPESIGALAGIGFKTKDTEADATKSMYLLSDMLSAFSGDE